MTPPSIKPNAVITKNAANSADSGDSEETSSIGKKLHHAEEIAGMMTLESLVRAVAPSNTFVPPLTNIPTHAHAMRVLASHTIDVLANSMDEQRPLTAEEFTNACGCILERVMGWMVARSTRFNMQEFHQNICMLDQLLADAMSKCEPGLNGSHA
ncbi:hypothetical protein CERSUDRAFT_119569 [Gelatoporia subvermispora B]|uniref:Uncharacterized protein n=1 Tax=Ceriporiopsis subvermispora (strain B) TaxID=914234 RepID=M2QYV3_CERS8|nr:hypothetical protein CERSUDRAFT_119569 [Gelatoporia subvermispora B]